MKGLVLWQRSLFTSPAKSSWCARLL